MEVTRFDASPAQHAQRANVIIKDGVATAQPTPIKDLFPDIVFATVAARKISEAIGKPISIEDSATQDMLDSVTLLRVFSSESLNIESIKGIGHFRNLTDLYLERLPIAELPEELGSLAKLTFLYLINLQIKSLPHWMGKLTSLVHLSLHNVGHGNGNGEGGVYGEVPESFGNLKKLETLKLDNNENLSGPLPDALSKLTLLREITVQGNRFSDLTVLNKMPPGTLMNMHHQRLGTSDLGVVAAGSELRKPLPEILIQAQTEGDILYDRNGVSVLGHPEAALSKDGRSIYLPTLVTGQHEITVGFKTFPSTSITYTYTVR